MVFSDFEFRPPRHPAGGRRGRGGHEAMSLARTQWQPVISLAWLGICPGQPASTTAVGCCVREQICSCFCWVHLHAYGAWHGCRNKVTFPEMCQPVDLWVFKTPCSPWVLSVHVEPLPHWTTTSQAAITLRFSCLTGNSDDFPVILPGLHMSFGSRPLPRL